jgi:hypothetical protein
MVCSAHRGPKIRAGLPIDGSVLLSAWPEPVRIKRGFQIKRYLDQTFQTDIQVPGGAGCSAPCRRWSGPPDTRSIQPIPEFKNPNKKSNFAPNKP